MKQEQIKIYQGKVLSIGYNTIGIKEKGGNERVLYFDGLQKRVLNDVDVSILKRLKKIEFTGGEFWEVGINFLICCDRCSNPILPLNLDEEHELFFNDKNVCGNCEVWVCSDCFDYGKCKKCLKREIIRRLK